MSDLEMWSIVVGFLAPLVIAVVQRPSWDPRIRVATMVVFCLVVGGVTAYLNDQFKGKTIVQSILLVLIAAIASYKGIWKPSQIAPKIEQVTSPNDTPRE